MRKLAHAEPEAFTRLMRGEASREEAMRVVRHLLSGCGVCRERSAAAQMEAAAADSYSYSQASAQAGERLVGSARRPTRLRLLRAGQRG